MGKSRVLLLAFLLFALAISSAYSQSDEIIDSVLDQDTISYGNAAYLVLSATGEVSESSTPQSAISSQGTSMWGFEGKTAESQMSYGEFSYMLMTSFDMSGGLLYRVFPGPRYAAREMSFLGIAPSRVAPGKNLSGADALQMLNEVMELVGGNQ